MDWKHLLRWLLLAAAVAYLLVWFVLFTDYRLETNTPTHLETIPRHVETPRASARPSPNAPAAERK
jgi:hypothetical protein